MIGGLKMFRHSQIDTVFQLVDLNAGGSHVTLRHNSGAMLTVPARCPIKPVYIRKLVDMIDQLEKNHE